MASERRLRAVSPDATPEEAAAITAAVVELERRRRVEAESAAGAALDPQRLDHWRAAARLSNRRVGMTRGPWRLSGRIALRSRA